MPVRTDWLEKNKTNEDDVKNVRIAAADLESAEFERDHASLNR
ncbi:hypothetical protein [Arthrobacter sp. H14]|nr:hypothetical protein [Arthrobacter sp. H14]